MSDCVELAGLIVLNSCGKLDVTNDSAVSC